MEQPELISLIERCRAGDPDAQEKLVKETQNKVYYHCRKFLKNEEDAQDAAQDVLIAMITSLDKLREPAAFWGWVNSITARRCKFLLTRGTKEWQIPEDEEGNSMLDSIETLDEQTVPDKAVDNAETQRLMMGIIDGLPPEQRMTVTFFYYDEMSVKAIAETMQVSEGTVKSRLNYARKSIKEEVEKLEKKDGTKLYSVSLLPFLAYFLRREAQGLALSAPAAQALTQGTLEAAGTTISAAAGAGTSGAAGAGTSATAGAGSSATAGAGSSATAGAGTSGAAGAGTSAAAAESGTAVKIGMAAAAGGTKAAGTASVKIVAAVLAGVLAVGGIGGGVYLATHREEKPDEQPVSDPARIEEPPAPSEEPPDEPIPPEEEQEEDYAAPYAQKVRELAESGETLFYGLVYIDEDDVPELIASSEYEDSVSVYTVSGGELQVIKEQWSMGRMGVPSYYPRMNAVREDYSTMNIDHADTSHIFFHINDAFEPEEFFRHDGEFWGDGLHDEEDNAFEEPEELQGQTPEPLLGTLTASEMLELLGADLEDASASGEAEPAFATAEQTELDFSPYVGTYAADTDMMELYSVEGLTDLTLNSDGSLSGGKASYSWSSTPLNCIQSEGQTPIRTLSGAESKGGPGSYTLILYDESEEIEGNPIPEEEYYILYPAGVADDRGGDSGRDRIFYANLVGGAWEMLFTKAD